MLAKTLTAAIMLGAGATAGASAALAYEVAEIGSFHIGSKQVTLAGLPEREIVFTPGAPPLKVDPNGDKLQAYFVSVDPERDTPEVMNQYVSNVSKRIVGISGAPDKVAEMVKGYRVYAKKVPVDENNPNGDYTMDHTASVFLLDSTGRFAGTIAYGENPDTAVKKLENLAKKG